MLGKTRRPELRAILDDYVKRISRSSPIEITEVRDGAAALRKLDADRAATAVLLDAEEKISIPTRSPNGSRNSATAAPASSSFFAAMPTAFPSRSASEPIRNFPSAP
jgi:hypothetical protein